jgi:hypothetical protein
MKQNITKIPDFDDLIFETRNKDYGAYQLRKKYNSALMTGIIAALFLAGIAVLIPLVSGKPDDRVLAGGTRYIKMEMDRLEPPREEIYIPPAPPPPESKEIQKIVEYVTPEIVDTIIPIDETPELISGGWQLLLYLNVIYRIKTIPSTQIKFTRMDGIYYYLKP